MITFENVTTRLLEHIPEFQAAYDETTASFGSEDTQYLVIGELLITFISGSSQDVIKRVFAFIELCAASDQHDLVELVQMGFLEDLITSDIPIELFVPYMGKHTIILYNELREWSEAKLTKKDIT